MIISDAWHTAAAHQMINHRVGTIEFGDRLRIRRRGDTPGDVGAFHLGA